MSKVYKGQVSIIMNTRGELALRKDPEGRFSAANAAELHETLQHLSKRHKVPINKYSLFIAENGKVPVLLANRFGQPYLAILPESPAEVVARKRAVKKLA